MRNNPASGVTKIKPGIRGLVDLGGYQAACGPCGIGHVGERTESRKGIGRGSLRKDRR